jgi:hypothetical protein
MFVLPISGAPVRLRAPEGRDELQFSEAAVVHQPREFAVELRVEAVRRLAPPLDPAERWDQLPFADVDAALLALRSHLTGDRVIAGVRCAGCSEWCDTELSIAQYLRANQPRRIMGLERDGEGWYRWRGARFRVPAVADVLSAVRLPHAQQSKALREAALPEPSGNFGRRIGRLLERIAPALAGEVRGTCPHCEDEVRGWFDPGAFVLAELQSSSRILLDHVHLLAQAYGWTEETILTIPARRRAFYAARIGADRGQERVQ